MIWRLIFMIFMMTLGGYVDIYFWCFHLLDILLLEEDMICLPIGIHGRVYYLPLSFHTSIMPNRMIRLLWAYRYIYDLPMILMILRLIDEHAWSDVLLHARPRRLPFTACSKRPRRRPPTTITKTKTQNINKYMAPPLLPLPFLARALPPPKYYCTITKII